MKCQFRDSDVGSGGGDEGTGICRRGRGSACNMPDGAMEGCVPGSARRLRCSCELRLHIVDTMGSQRASSRLCSPLESVGWIAVSEDLDARVCGHLLTGAGS